MYIQVVCVECTLANNFKSILQLKWEGNWPHFIGYGQAAKIPTFSRFNWNGIFKKSGHLG